MSLSDYSQLAPGVTISCRDEHWLVSNGARTSAIMASDWCCAITGLKREGVPRRSCA
ncbi:hypothetical protein [Corynebacterium aurimucosum]|uniref:hypothetical protein n=1 Tax=Corynebacterium aurimucosum TaxID=169292 RepID=UPI0018797490|nr:hypothetical protein [Corynebacterium aurimucosum]MBE7339839.1 hypothetical protein [Corynebacterium aurimucosum]